MRKTQLLPLAFAAVLSTLGVAQAQTQPQTQAPGLSRAEVIQELQRARASGELEAMHSESINAVAPLGASHAGLADLQARRAALAAQVAAKPAGKTRAEVIAELQRARETGELAEIQSEGGPGYYPVARSELSGPPLFARLRGKQ